MKAIASTIAESWGGASAVVTLLTGIGETQRPTEFRRLFRLQLIRGISDARRLRLIEAGIADDAHRAVTEGGH
jgi:hypothetical protein